MYGTKSKYGDMDITGEGAMEFFTRRRKVTTRWPKPSTTASAGAGAGAGAGAVDKASFVGHM